jgi:hypothetical protein
MQNIVVRYRWGLWEAFDIVDPDTGIAWGHTEKQARQAACDQLRDRAKKRSV